MTNQRKLTRTAAAFLALSVFLTLSASAPAIAAQARKERTLYQRLGGYDALADAFPGIDAEAGDPCVYMGRDMKTTHQGLGLTEADWNVAVGHLIEALDKFKVGKREKNEVLTFVSSLKKDIVEK
jgi:hemoglobin